MGCDFSEIKNLFNDFKKMEQSVQKDLIEATGKELAARTLTKVIKLTPVFRGKGDIYQDKDGVTRQKSYKTVEFTTKSGQAVKFKVKRSKLGIGGTLRRGWVAKTEIEAQQRKNDKPDADDIMKASNGVQVGATYQIEIKNPVSYAPYVEYGHRTKKDASWGNGSREFSRTDTGVKQLQNKSSEGWQKGHFMLENSMDQLRQQAPQIIEKKTDDFIKKVLK